MDLSNKEKKQVEELLDLISPFFHDEEMMKMNWLNSKNPLLANNSPLDFILQGRYSKLKKFIKSQLEERDTSGT